jgi:hypothetical protein
VTAVWRKLHNEKLHESYSSPNINRIIKSRDGHDIQKQWEDKTCTEDFSGKFRKKLTIMEILM